MIHKQPRFATAKNPEITKKLFINLKFYFLKIFSILWCIVPQKQPWTWSPKHQPWNLVPKEFESIQSSLFGIKSFSDKLSQKCFINFSPGIVSTGIYRTRGWSTESIEEFYPKIAEKSLMKRIGAPDDIANLASFLASDDARNITGSIYVSDSGALLAPPQLAQEYKVMDEKLKWELDLRFLFVIDWLFETNKISNYKSGIW